MDLQPAPSNQANLNDQAPLIAPGLYLNAAEIDIHFEMPIDFLVNVKSVNLKNHKDPLRRQGCRGPGDLSVLNQVCPNCSTEIGVIVEDCWLPHFVGISGEKVSGERWW